MATLAHTQQVSPFAVFRNRSFTLLWTGEFISTVGSALTSLAASIMVFRLTHSAMSVGLMLMATAIPSIFVGAGLSFSIPFLVPHNIAWLYIIVMLSSAVGQFYNPAHESVLPEVATDRVIQAPSGTVILRRGEISDAAYFILNGRAVAGRDEDGNYRSLEVLNNGDFFGEIAALTGVPRTENVIAEEPTTLIQVSASTLRQLMSDPQINRMFLSKMTERMIRMNMLDLPRFAGLDQQSLRKLRTANPDVYEGDSPVQAK